MALTYFKRYRMEINLHEGLFDRRPPAEGFRLVAWSDKILREHATVKYESFHNEIDANVFPCLGDRNGCAQLMRDISNRSNFVPEATWLATYQDEFMSKPVSVGTVQGLRTDGFEGGIQNLGVIPKFRGHGVGSQLLFKALEGFYLTGCQIVHLEVTVQNTAAVRLYERLGFRRVETVFKVADVAMAN
jgi:[ribosomal protein S18]-alanine N-acetyltransferase